MKQLTFFGYVPPRRRGRPISSERRRRFLDLVADERWRTPGEISVLCRIPVRRVFRYIDSLRSFASVNLQRRRYAERGFEFRVVAKKGGR